MRTTFLAFISMTLAGNIWAPSPAAAHPHVFVDGGIDLQFDGEGRLAALEVTWLYDEFETLYMLSSYALDLNDAGELDEADRLALVRELSIWPDDFDGSAHLTVDGEAVPLDWPEGVDATLEDGRLQKTFTRQLTEPLDLQGGLAEVAFYESTYFFAFSITMPPRMLGNAPDCRAEVAAFDPDAHSDLQDTLSTLGREETPTIPNVGKLFADRVLLTCG
ncbi:DUF1007 family protein [Pelagovum pacificum]|uniref:DUF1007 family protein n=1 Tax=Pelagovum pacificum TaxID=2588711 RepID=A0A5C5GDP4_9RHOB|nr:DUF1007 family protein [Pelagovum pacificum]QQA44258.1 DUF1007 family protein [Pelagovum pacificum]TNY32620.1 DUF1007 family protein [Pelagovum pacificum]